MNTGSILIVLSLCASLITLILFIVSEFEKKYSLKAARYGYYLSSSLVTFAMGVLLYAFLSNSFEYAYVYNYSSNDLSLIYLISGLWAGQEGSFLLWIFFLHIFGLTIIRFKDEYEGVLLAVITLAQLFLLFTISFPEYSPFRYIWEAMPDNYAVGTIPADGSGLNPLLQNPWMIVHPPVLFFGYAAITVPFAYAIAGLVKKDYSSWINSSYKWVIFSVTTLGVGIFLGAYWAYVVLGWGGYWGWDPVENSSLIPWLLIVALLHGMLLQKRRGALVKTNIFLSIMALVLVFYSTFLTRSGVLSDFSVHSFGDLGLSKPLLFYILFFLCLGLSLFIVRMKSITAQDLGESIFTADNLICMGLISLLIFTLLILIGTSMPILTGFFSPRPSTVQTDYYNNMSIMFGLLILIFIIMATLLVSRKKVEQKPVVAMACAAFVLGIVFNMLHAINIFAVIISMFAFFVIIQGVRDLYQLRTSIVLTSRVAHIGVGIMVIGIIASNIHSTSIQKSLTQGKDETVADTVLQFKGLSTPEHSEHDHKLDEISKSFSSVPHKNEKPKSALQLTMKDGNEVLDINMLYYFNQKMNSIYKEPYIRYGFLYDLYIAPLEFRSGAEIASRHRLSKGKTVSIQGMEAVFIGFNRKQMNMMKGTGKLLAEIALRINGKAYNISPGIEFSGGKRNEYLDAMLPGTRRRISLTGIDVQTKIIEIFVEPGKDDPVSPDVVIVDVSFKRLIWLVWLGTILISFSGIVALWKKRKQT